MPSLQPMTGKAVTNGWGAILVLSRDALNVALQQNVIQSFHNQTATAKVHVVAGQADQAVDRFEASGLVFGEPQLAFGAPELTGNQVVVTLPIVGGSFVASHHPIGAQLTVTGSGGISEAHGKQLRMTGTFTMTFGHVDGQARVILTLGGENENMQTNLAGENAAANQQLAALFKARFQEVGIKKRYTLCKVNCIDYAELSPMECTLHIQKNPEAVAGTPSAGDGAVVVLMQLKGMEGNGTIPNDGAPGTALPYYIPNDKASNGTPLYSTALIVARDMGVTGGTIPPKLAESIFFPTTFTHTFWAGVTRTPHDLVCFAKLVAGEGAYTMEPAQNTLLPGETQQFTVFDWRGAPVTVEKWDVIGLDNEVAGSISQTGLYTPHIAGVADPSSQVEVKATVTRDGQEYEASALLFIEYEPRSITPWLALRIASEHTPITFTYNAADATATTWHLVAPVYGELESNENEATFSPAEHAFAKTLKLVKQKLQASNGGQTSEAFAVFCHAQQLYDIAPEHLTFVKKNTRIPLRHDGTFLAEAKRRWSVVAGNGTVDEQGEFTAPPEGLPASNVVQCELVHNGVVFASGYSVLDLSEREPRATWDTLTKFWVKVNTEGTSGRLNGNGYQQLSITVYVTTMRGGENGTPVPLSLSEQRSIRLRLGTQDIPEVFEDYEGIEPGEADPGLDENDGKRWRTRFDKNSFYRKAYSVSSKAKHLDETTANNEIEKSFELHTREWDVKEYPIHARFQQDGGGWKESNNTEHGGGEGGVVRITPVLPDTFTVEHYDFPSLPNRPDKVRVDINGEPAGSAEDGDPPSGTDWDDYNLNTIDYWPLSLKNLGNDPRKFRTAIFLPSVDSTGAAVPPHLSMLQWESETYGEKMGSFTGYVFYPYKHPPGGPEAPPPDERFDSALQKISPSLGDNVNNYPQKINIGTFVFMLHRRDDLPYVHKDTSPDDVDVALHKLTQPIALRLVDSEGDVRSFVFSFAGSPGKSPRHRLEFVVR
jgi:hypothetical protein